MTTQGISRDPVLSDDWHVLARSADLIPDVLRKARLLGEDLVLWRDGDGQAHAWQDLCIHRGARLSLGKIEKNCVVCPYHGWKYNPEGRCVSIPAHPALKPPSRAKAQTFAVRERYGMVWVALGEPVHDVPPFPEYDDPAFRKVFCGPYLFKTSAPRVIENSFDIAHFPFVHEGILGNPDHAEINDYSVRFGPGGIEARDIQVFQNDFDGSGQECHTSYNYNIPRPLTTHFFKHLEGARFAVLFTVCPVAEFESLVWSVVAMSYDHDKPEERIVAFQDYVIAQDVGIVESQHPERLPRDLQAELHLRSDRVAIAYRRWINELGLGFGTA